MNRLRGTLAAKQLPPPPPKRPIKGGLEVQLPEFNFKACPKDRQRTFSQIGFTPRKEKAAVLRVAPQVSGERKLDRGSAPAINTSSPRSQIRVNIVDVLGGQN